MLSLEDERWSTLKGGYRMPFDARPAFLKLQNKRKSSEAWHELWEDLHHQGDVGEASYAAVPHIVRIYGEQSEIDWNPYGIVATIELARTEAKNPAIPDYLRGGYFEALKELAELGTKQIMQAQGPDTPRAILSVIALVKGERTHARFLIHYAADELLELEERSLG
jgi:hypothetical protein